MEILPRYGIGALEVERAVTISAHVHIFRVYFEIACAHYAR